MTDSNDKQPANNGESQEEENIFDSKASVDLSAIAAEALRRSGEEPKPRQPKSRPELTSADTADEGVTENQDIQQPEITSEEAPSTTEETVMASQASETENTTQKTGILSGTQANENQNPPETTDVATDANKSIEADLAAKKAETTTAEAIVNQEGNTTNDLQQEAIKAMKLESERQRDAKLKAKSTIEERSHFTGKTVLKLESKEGEKPITTRVNEELIVGRADNVTDYVPEIDLTPHGAYRLGLSRRHAIILREEDRVYVKDLNSRNGTFVNGAIVPGGGKMVIRNGDEIRFGNLAMRVSFLNE